MTIKVDGVSDADGFFRFAPGDGDPGLWQRQRHQLQPDRVRRMETVARGRTEQVHLVLQDIHHPHNVGACLRSAEAFGVQHIHVVDRRRQSERSTVSRGVNKWLSLHLYPDVAACVEALTARQIPLFAGRLGPGARPVEQLLDVAPRLPLGLVFGNEHDGVDREWDRHLAGEFTVPMWGMVESLNISVAAALALFVVTSRLRREGRALMGSQRVSELLDEWMRCHLSP